MLARLGPAMLRSLHPRRRLPLFSLAQFAKTNPALRSMARLPGRTASMNPSFVKLHSTMSEKSRSRPSHNREMFAYTSGRYLYNEKHRMAERYVEFNIDALRKVAAQSVNRESVAHMRKLAEGGFNRVLLLTMNDGLEVIVKIPYSIAGPKKLATESEVATLDFLHSKGIPVPRVYAYSSETNNEVGSEYIIMEKAAGQPLEAHWFNLTTKEQSHLVTSYVDIERKLFSIPFSCYGSIYYKRALPREQQADLYAPGTEDNDGDSSRFCIGPTADYMYWRGKRAQLEISRGPWKDHRDYLRSTGLKERDLTMKFGKPKINEFPHNTVLKGEIPPNKYVDLLNKYLTISQYLLPEDGAHVVNRPILRHPDLNPTNIYVTGTCDVSCILDWQHTTILPLLMAAGNPPAFENPDPEPPKDYSKPSLPEDYESLDAEAKSQADELHRRRMLFYLYMIFNGKDNKPHLNAMRYPGMMLIQHLVDRAGRPWTGNIVTLKGALIRVINHWPVLMSTRTQRHPCPIQFDAKDEEEFYDLEEKWFKFNMLVEYWRSLLDDVGQDGWVRNDSFEKVVEVNQQLRKQWIDEAEDEEDLACVESGWPFQDHEEDD
ncbi:uncharacterized protein CIMG_04670 [Coccidioides immitis RS]|uniref:Aminoglycoside phosphotransferase domain-containing protein n=4 Tax=Coccidioides immitis TaxID=5501 RepID=J3KDZ2_COCIM|nr:uncharacterized protein CIMG_04670 [Coccidioides immitis RS]EAS33646.3 hypothetical protein CIMG_04670 [Coccidioides immitis RS]KMP04833.1 hypothetical protein CIRG_04514 [Coccidioides immitis RMSCC 2394]KMU86330.1 hypothetical protein CIHG_04119 [Coccidioides immitis H538.4]TPX21314.1 Phosphotransferase enzyme [Coccidioides immitis]